MQSRTLRSIVDEKLPSNSRQPINIAICQKYLLIFKRKKLSSDFVPSSLEESIQLLDSLEKPPKQPIASKTSKITNHILNSAVDLNISHGDITNEQEAGCSYSTEPSTIDLIWKSTVESTRKRSIPHSSKKLWSFMNLQKPAVYRINRKFIQGSLDLNSFILIFSSISSKINYIVSP